MALLLPYPKGFELSEKDCYTVSNILGVSIDDAKRWGSGQPITIMRGTDALILEVHFDRSTYVINEMTFWPHTEVTIHRTYDTMKLLDAPGAVELSWEGFKVPIEKEVVLTLSPWHYFKVKNNSDQPCTVKVLNGYWPNTVRKNTKCHDGIKYSEHGEQPLFD